MAIVGKSTAGESLVSIRVEKLKEAKAMLSHIKNGVRDALMGAINETSKEQRTYISRQIRTLVNIKKADIDKRITIKHATKTNVTGAVVLKESERLSLKYFGATQTKTGVRYKIAKAKGKKPVLDGGFMGPKPGAVATRLGGHAFKRTGKARLPIVKLHGPSAWGVFVKNDLQKPTEADTQVKLEKNFKQRVNYLIKKAAGQL